MVTITDDLAVVRHQLEWLHGKRAPIFEAQGATIDTSRALAALDRMEQAFEAVSEWCDVSPEYAVEIYLASQEDPS